MASAIKTACPGFASYRVESDGGVEVRGEFPIWDPGSAQEAKLLKAWADYGDWVAAAGKRTGVPASWLIAILVQESGGNPFACSPCSICNPSICVEGAGFRCCAFGLMQFIDSTARAYGASGPQLMGKPKLAIDIAAEFVADKMEKHGFDPVLLAAAYNAGTPRCGGSSPTFGLVANHDYPMSVVKYSNTALALELQPPPPFLGMGVMGGMLAAVGIGAAYAIHTGTIKV